MPHLSKSEALIHLIIFNGLLDHVASSTARVVNRIYAIGGEGATTYVGLPTPEDPSRDPSDDSSFLQLIHSDGWTPARSGRPVASPSASRMQTPTAGAVGQAVIQIADWKPARVFRADVRSSPTPGAGAVIDTNTEDLQKWVPELTAGKGVDAVFDTAGGDLSLARDIRESASTSPITVTSSPGYLE